MQVSSISREQSLQHLLTEKHCATASSSTCSRQLEWPTAECRAAGCSRRSIVKRWCVITIQPVWVSIHVMMPSCILCTTVNLCEYVVMEMTYSNGLEDLAIGIPPRDAVRMKRGFCCECVCGYQIRMIEYRIFHVCWEKLSKDMIPKPDSSVV